MNENTDNLQIIRKIVEDKKAKSPVIIDLRDAPIPTDYFVIAQGENPMHVKAITRALQTGLPHKPLHREGASEQRWVVLDYGEVVVHIFTKQARDFYDIESLWADHVLKSE